MPDTKMHALWSLSNSLLIFLAHEVASKGQLIIRPFTLSSYFLACENSDQPIREKSSKVWLVGFCSVKWAKGDQILPVFLDISISVVHHHFPALCFCFLFLQLKNYTVSSLTYLIWKKCATYFWLQLGCPMSNSESWYWSESESL